jgi:hypothetical protein
MTFYMRIVVTVAAASAILMFASPIFAQQGTRAQLKGAEQQR